ncbi:hypothetical protein BC833DRAFT_602970 [Globomyces pollinis-pini]|nr:hypothetical protein BC833DRAFT_602970 [Globomyces pollinis-pini]
MKVYKRNVRIANIGIRFFYLRFQSTFAQYRLDEFLKLKTKSTVPSLTGNRVHSEESFWHSAAHILGWAMESKYGSNCFLTDGPANSDGFFYDALLIKNLSPDFIKSRSYQHINELIHPNRIQSDISKLLHEEYGPVQYVTDSDLKQLTKMCMKLASQNKPFEYATVSKEESQKIFIHSPFKLSIIDKIPKDDPITLFRCGDFVDLCRGPHISNTEMLKVFSLTKTGATQWEPGLQNLSRVYGVAFNSTEKLKEYKVLQAQAESRNHRTIGRKQDLFTFHPYSPGSPFFLPHGIRIIQKLKEFLRNEYKEFGFQEVVTPLIFSKELWEKSGHWQNYKEDMFTLASSCDHHNHEDSNDGDTMYSLKPMNCPGHCLLFNETVNSYRDLPLRFAEFSPLHRNEASGALTGLTRVRMFHQDDGHIFCTKEQIFSEIQSSLKFIDKVYKIFGFPSYELTLSTRPTTNYIGTIEEWDHAEESLKGALESTKNPWSVKQGDGAFYGPKIDVMVRDSMNRSHQTATIQLDFQLPQRFALQYQDKNGSYSTPVIVHRAVLGSIERMFAILIEHYGGKWPFWVSPRQCIVVTTRLDCNMYGEQVQMQLSNNGKYFADGDFSDKSLAKKVREAQQKAYNFIIVVGDKEAESGEITVRTRDGKQLSIPTVEQLLEHFEVITNQYQ